jgi:hypothetical protein
MNNESQHIRGEGNHETMSHFRTAGLPPGDAAVCNGQCNTGARCNSLTIQPGEVTVLHLRPEFESTIHLPEEVTSVVLGSPSAFKAEHSEGEPNYVYVKPIKRASQSNLLISTRSGQHVSLELMNDGTDGGLTPVDFLLDYKPTGSFLVRDTAPASTADGSKEGAVAVAPPAGPRARASAGAPPSALELEYEQQQRINTPDWSKWENKQFETSLGDVRQWGNQVAVSFSVLNTSGHAIEIVPPPDTDCWCDQAKEKEERQEHYRGPDGGPGFPPECDTS